MRPNNKKNQAKTRSQGRAAANDNSDDEYSFQSPDDENETDYGLEFTTSRLANLQTSRRSSTLRKKAATSRRDAESVSNSNDENSENITPTSRGAVNRVSQQPVPSQQKPPERIAPRPRTRRKQPNPQQRERRMQREIARLQATPGLLIPRLPFSKVVREILMGLWGNDISCRITVGALQAIQTAAEMYLTQRFEDAYLLTRFRGRVTLEARDMALVDYFCKTYSTH